MVKSALLIGINYVGTSSELRGCHRDIAGMQECLALRGYTQFTVLADDGINTSPTRAAILGAFATCIEQCKAGDYLYIHYSGHGTWVRDASGDEADGRDECICPLDYETTGVITDDELCSLICRANAGAKLRVVFDSCHSGSALDLPIRWVGGSKTFRENNSCPLDPKGNPLNIFFLSGCQDEQTSADARINGNFNGALTYSWLAALADAAAAAKTSPYSWRDIGNSCQLWLKKNGYRQVPQVSVCIRAQLSNPVDL
jgi:metacaspase-1